MPQRFLRPGLTESDRWNACSFEAQSMYVRLLTLVDDFGRYDGRVAVLHAHCFALRPDIKPQRTATLRSELHEKGLIKIYTVDDKEYIQVLRWHEHARGTRSRYPSEIDNPQESVADRSEPQESATSLVPRSSIIVPSVICQQEKTDTKALERVCKLFHRRSSTQLDATEQRAWRNAQKSVESTSEEDWAILEWTYAQKGGEVSQYRRQDMATLLNNWNGQIERSRGWKTSKVKSVL